MTPTDEMKAAVERLTEACNDAVADHEDDMRAGYEAGERVDLWPGPEVTVQVSDLRLLLSNHLPRPVDMRKVVEALGFDPENHHNAAKCPYCTPADPRPTPSGDGLVEALPRRLPDAVIEACAEAHFGKRRARAAGGARGIAMTVAGRDYSWRDMMGHIWPVIRQALAHHTPVCRDSEEGGWRPIETAPRDGTAVLLWFPKRYQGNGGLSWGCFIGGDCLDSRAIRDNDASHWMPMPAAPPKDPDHV
jgi:hypothetical protein